MVVKQKHISHAHSLNQNQSKRRMDMMTELESQILQYLNEYDTIAHSSNDIHYNLVHRRELLDVNREAILRTLHELENQGLVHQPDPQRGFFQAVTQDDSSIYPDR